VREAEGELVAVAKFVPTLSHKRGGIRVGQPRRVWFDGAKFVPTLSHKRRGIRVGQPGVPGGATGSWLELEADGAAEEGGEGDHLFAGIGKDRQKF
jgi:hypothetical protein